MEFYLKFAYCCIFVIIAVAEGIRNGNVDVNPEKENLILEEEKRAAEKPEAANEENQDLEKSHTNRGLFVTTGIHDHRPHSSSYDISSYGGSGPEYHYRPSGGDTYRPGHISGTSGYGINFHHPSSSGPEEYGPSGPPIKPSPPQHSNGAYNALALKKLLIPLAGLVLLGAATALSTNPILFQLGVVSGKRKRRDTRKEHINDVYTKVSRYIEESDSKPNIR